MWKRLQKNRFKNRVTFFFHNFLEKNFGYFLEIASKFENLGLYKKNNTSSLKFSI